MRETKTEKTEKTQDRQTITDKNVRKQNKIFFLPD